MQAFNADSITFTGSTEAVLTTYTGHDGFSEEPVTEYIPVVYAQNPHGDRKGCYLGHAMRACHEAEERADQTAVKLAARAARGMLPVGFMLGAHWFDARPVYGSDAYVEYGQADDLAWEARCDADERI